MKNIQPSISNFAPFNYHFRNRQTANTVNTDSERIKYFNHKVNNFPIKTGIKMHFNSPELRQVGAGV